MAIDRQQIIEFAKSDPRFSQAILMLEQQIGDMPITSEGIAELVKMLEFALEHPDKYEQVKNAAVKDGYVEAGDMPEQFDKVALVSLLVILYGMQERTKAKGFKRGGLASAKCACDAAKHGRGGDTMLAHINPREAAMLKRAGGGGTTNPVTGLPEYFSLKKFFAAALPIALSIIAPGIGTAIGAALGASGTAASVIGSAIIGGASAKLGGGNVLQGALLGGLGGGLGGAVGSTVSDTLGLGLGTAGQAALGSGLVGGVAGMATGQGFAKGALSGAAGQYLGSQLGAMGGDPTGAFGRGLAEGGKQFGNMMAAGYDPKTSAVMGGLSGLASGMSGARSASTRPSDAVLKSLSAPVTDVGMGDISGNNVSAADAQSSGSLSDIFSMKNAMPLLSVASALGGQPAPPAATAAVNTLSPQQQEYFNRPSVTWDWSKMQQDANQAGMGLSQFMAQNWNKVASGAYNVAPTVAPVKLARGGLGRVASMMDGHGSGRDDTISAKLSDGEYVIDAETVALLGDGSTKEGARRLDAMREQIRSHKGRSLAKGKISPDAKMPLAYMKGA